MIKYYSSQNSKANSVIAHSKWRLELSRTFSAVKNADERSGLFHDLGFENVATDAEIAKNMQGKATLFAPEVVLGEDEAEIAFGEFTHSERTGTPGEDIALLEE